MSINPPDPEVPPRSDSSGNSQVPPPQVAKPAGGSIWGGVGVGCGGYIILAVFVFALTSSALSNENLLISLAGGPLFYFTFLVIPLMAATVLSIPLRTRRIGVGMFITAAALWLVAIGPCIAFTENL